MTPARDVRYRPVVAVVAHSCAACTGPIDYGDQHLRVLVLDQGVATRFSVCARCAKASGRGHDLKSSGVA